MQVLKYRAKALKSSWAVYDDYGNRICTVNSKLNNQEKTAQRLSAVPDLYHALECIRDEIAEEIQKGGGIFSDIQLAHIDEAMAKYPK